MAFCCLEQGFAELPEARTLFGVAGGGGHGLTFGEAPQAAELIGAIVLTALGRGSCGGMKLG